jgi:hypothetical protein
VDHRPNLVTLTLWSRIYMTLVMGGAMGLVMLVWMLTMLRNVWLNVAVIVASVVLLGLGITLDRTQTGVDDTRFMQAMIPHHSLAILRSEQFTVTDPRVCELAIEISESQRREILEMDWLINDINTNGPATSADERPVPEFAVEADRRC